MSLIEFVSREHFQCTIYRGIRNTVHTSNLSVNEKSIEFPCQLLVKLVRLKWICVRCMYGRDSCSYVCVTCTILSREIIHTHMWVRVNKLRRVNNKLLILSSTLNSRSGTLISRLDCVVFNKTPDLRPRLSVVCVFEHFSTYIICSVHACLTKWENKECHYPNVDTKQRKRLSPCVSDSNSSFLSVRLINPFRIFMKTEEKCSEWKCM